MKRIGAMNWCTPPRLTNQTCRAAASTSWSTIYREEGSMGQNRPLRKRKHGDSYRDLAESRYQHRLGAARTSWATCSDGSDSSRAGLTLGPISRGLMGTVTGRLVDNEISPFHISNESSRHLVPAIGGKCSVPIKQYRSCAPKPLDQAKNPQSIQVRSNQPNNMCAPS